MSAQPWGRSWGWWLTDTGTRVEMQRKGQRVRFIASDGTQHGPEYANVVPAMWAAYAAGWCSLGSPAWLRQGCQREARSKMVLL